MEYSLPRHVSVSAECQDLLRRILVAEPERRITMEQIQRHPWCLHDLPEGVAELNSKLLSQPEELDPEGVQVRLPVITAGGMALRFGSLPYCRSCLVVIVSDISWKRESEISAHLI